mmetsp:Transcript_9132/g.27478  ORF Transcript_9132/g.27478 Transcript_9132/m.27478 type:complete len:164 (-) Transcript_9132:489-980(-)|eukprot:CAMPEP_0198733224 /NCGR_PEP_ID=MMETSP1475-20131203/43782_1 /TAXON_ID= ORGANISM="Unidentified sp., Strain CCMP1999" /NCGR_SAMPLE_ID=MMETSP1475 /ASSEMBLY_ACC=CAM_ASM_001111 /LENGTH=163 /DNA_ID=CAMNT_0044496483 /DNA_START=918 /DNA_END=1409 /DNA_ORIENTATION=-
MSGEGGDAVPDRDYNDSSPNHKEREFLSVVSEVLRSDADLERITRESGSGQVEEKVSRLMEQSQTAPMEIEGAEREEEDLEAYIPEESVSNQGDGSRTCDVCHKVFKYPYLLKIHSIAHSDEKPNECPHCTFRCKWRSTMKYHITRMHADVAGSSSRSVPNPR